MYLLFLARARGRAPTSVQTTAAEETSSSVSPTVYSYVIFYKAQELGWYAKHMYMTQVVQGCFQVCSAEVKDQCHIFSLSTI